MARRRYKAEEIILILRRAEVELQRGMGLAEVVRKLGIVEQTYYRWRREYGGLEVNQAKKLKSLVGENSRLKRLVADLSLDNALLKDVAQGNF